ncbi:PAS domain S-box protein [Gulosibacter molinativorax]|uniref:PAS domain S-box protein n=1 Tax=Gulosibacter molinativorax TaxID=256821 RepID=A0ABT7C4A9_9MICO|nr:PAS domain-containing protein [Gulosibacter molinativorax]MDJ1370052.1 PAS domain S-box protein [Gulosibacter molinativorax]QUY63757.1 Two-component hybrid sensor and regulator [Gulosibacter molinativorax]
MTNTEPDFKRMFEALPSQYIVVDPNRIVVAATDSFLESTARTREGAMGRDILEVFPDNPDDPEAKGTTILRESIERVLASKQIDILPAVRYDLDEGDGTFNERWFQPLNAPVLDDAGEILYVLHGAEDITEQMKAQNAR